MRSQISRRGFIGAAAAAAALPATGVRGAGKKWQMRMSASTVAFTKLKVEEACKKIAELGFEAVDIWCPFRACVHLEDARTRLGADGLKKVLAENNLKLNAFSVYNGGYKKYAELLKGVGGGVAVRGSSGKCKPEEITAKMKAFIESLKPLVELAEENGDYLAIENHGNALLDSLDSFKAFTDINTSKHLGIAMAPYHLQGIKASVPEAIRIVGDQLFFFYAWQRAKGVGQLPGHGPADCKPWLKALADIKYKRYVNPFMHHEPEPEEMVPALKKSADYLRSCYNEIVAGE